MKNLKDINLDIFKLAQLGEISPKTKCAYLKIKYPEAIFPFDWMFDQTTVQFDKRKKDEMDDRLNRLSVTEIQAHYHKKGIKWLTILDDLYPKELSAIFSPPLLLFYCGNVQLLSLPNKLAVVGPRKCSDYGLRACDLVLRHFIHHYKKAPIVSGLAAGIDTHAHQLALEYQAPTIAVLGTGLDKFYPKRNQKLQQYLMKNQLVLSEYPLQSKPLKHHFPYRNRIIAGLCRGVLIAEAKQRSGSLITASYALDEGRDVFAIPGDIFSLTSRGTNHLIQQGAICVADEQTVIEEWDLQKIKLTP
ncbi:DNA-processing protein DprA [Allofustis seminis]|uniref:DNA-processing protein DprA n=1 Tax=Allofustis seminis TaxID=166939 RepID=UPI000373E7E6|nr:DNA-processing protein DprA [Allofustis seminis]